MSDVASIPIPGGSLDLIRGSVHLDGTEKRLSPIEVAVLSVLWESRPEPATEDRLLERAWGYRTRNTRTVSMGMSRLRAKIERDPKSPVVLLTVRGKGYRLVPAAAREVETAATTAAVGRSADLDAIQDRFRAGASVVEIIGPGGIGKSTLARDLASERARWVDLEGVTSSAGVLRRLSAALDAPGADGERAVREALRDETRLILDNAQGLDAEARRLLERLLSSTRAKSVITTRQALGIGKPVLLGELSAAAALQLVNQTRADLGLPDVDAAALEPVLQAFGGHALALVVSAPLIELSPDAETVLAMGEANDLPAVLRSTVAALPEGAEALLEALASFAVPPGIPTIRDRTGLQLPTLLRSLHELRDRGLVELRPDGIRVHPFVQHVVSTEQAAVEHAGWAARQRLDPSKSRAVRHEIEHALQQASGDDLAELLLRHLLLLHTYGPVDGLQSDLAVLLQRIGDERSDILWGTGLVLTHEAEAAVETLLRAVDLQSDPRYAAFGWIYLIFASAWSRDVALTRRAVAALTALRPDIAHDPDLHALATLQLVVEQVQSNPDAVEPMIRELERADHPEMAVAAAFSKLRASRPTAAEIRRCAGLLQAIGPEALGEDAFCQRMVHLAQAWLEAGDLDRGEAIAREWAERFAATRSPHLTRGLARTAAYVLDRTELATFLLSFADASAQQVRGLNWLLGGAQGPPPVEDPLLAGLLEGTAQKTPIAPVPEWYRLSLALAAFVERGG